MFLSSELDLEWEPGRSQVPSSTCSIIAVENIPEVPLLDSGASLLLEITNTLYHREGMKGEFYLCMQLERLYLGENCTVGAGNSV